MKAAWANKLAAPNPAIASQLQVRRHGRGIGEPGRWAMKRIFLIVAIPLLFALSALAAESRVDDALFLSARTALPKASSTNGIVRVLQAGLWNSNRTAVAVSFPGPAASVVFVFLRQTSGTYLAVDTSGVEGGNFGKLGIAGRSGYDRFETKPVQWLHRDDGLFQVVMRTRAWKARQRYTVSEALVIQPDGTVLWR